MIKLLFIFFIFQFTSFAFEKENLEYQGEVGSRYRAFQADDNKDNKDYQFSLETRFQSKYVDENNIYHFGFFSRIDQNDSTRNIINFDEIYYSRAGIGSEESITFTIGNKIFNWSMMEIFHPVDNINSRNFDSNGDLIERLGQPSLILKKEFELKKSKLNVNKKNSNYINE